MTWLKRALPAVALLLCVIASPSLAQIAGHPIEVSGGLGTVFYDTRARLQDRGALVGSVGYRLAPWLVGEVGGLYSKSYADTTPNPKATFTLLSADLRFNLRPAEGRVVPFLLAGLGYGASKRDDADPEKLGRGTPSLGAGALFNIMGRQRWYARVQGRDILFKERDSFEFGHDLAVTASVQYLFGGKPHDSDLDEVRDWLDKCPDTPIGAKVDAAGCPTDSDRDSV